MAISKERLEELIKQSATIWSTDTKMYSECNMLELNGDKKHFDFNEQGQVKLFLKSGWWHWFDLDKVFETKEEAQEYLEFGNATRTEKLELPSWEKFQKGYETDFCVGLSNFYLYIAKNNFNQYEKLIRISQDKYIDKGMYVNKDHIIIFEKELTKENYDEARKLCVKLFKGESK